MGEVNYLLVTPPAAVILSSSKDLPFPPKVIFRLALCYAA